MNKNPKDLTVVSLYIIENVTHEKPLSFVAYVCPHTPRNPKTHVLYATKQ